MEWSWNGHSPYIRNFFVQQVKQVSTTDRKANNEDEKKIMWVDLCHLANLEMK